MDNVISVQTVYKRQNFIFTIILLLPTISLTTTSKFDASCWNFPLKPPKIPLLDLDSDDA